MMWSVSRVLQRFSLVALCAMAGFTMWHVQATAQGSNAAHGKIVSGDARNKKEVRFEVISIRPLMPGGQTGTGYTPNPTPDGFVSSLTVWQMIMIAYAPDDQSWGSIPIIAHTSDSVPWNSDSSSSVKSSPKWFGDWYVINARVSDADRDAWRNQSKNHELLRSAMRDLLRERCKLVLREEPTELPDYKLVIGKKGLKGLEATAPGSAPPKEAYRLPTGAFKYATGERNRPTWHYYRATMGDLVEFLSPAGTGSPAPPVHDETGLTGRYDFALTMVDEPSRDWAEEIFNFPLEPLGLALKAGKYPGVKLVINHMEKPTAND